MSYVIDYSQNKGGALLCLLMIANHADRFGRNSFPGLATLAAECRMSERQIYRLISVIEESGELKTEREGGGRGRIKGFQIVMGNPDKMSSFIGVDNSGESVKAARGNPDIYGKETLTFTVKKGDILGRYKENHLSEINLSDKESGPGGPVSVDKSKAGERHGDLSGAHNPDLAGSTPAPASRSKPGQKLTPDLKAAADPLYRSDPKRFQKLIIWIWQKQKEGHIDVDISAVLRALRAREEKHGPVDDWWKYLQGENGTGQSMVDRERSRRLEAEAEEYKKPGPVKLGDLPALVQLARIGKQ